MENLAGKKVLVMGLGRFGGGVGVSKWLVEQGAIVTVNDSEPAEKLAASIEQLAGLPITFKLGGHDLVDFLASDLMVLNPAVDKEKSEVVRTALANSKPYTTEMNLFLERASKTGALVIGITGSVGKSTTTMLIYDALRAGVSAHTRVFLGGNIGKSLLSDLLQIRPDDIVVLELSSFMLEETPRIGWSPHIAVVTNLFANHLDRHNTMEGYARAKQNILAFQKSDDVAILNADHAEIAGWEKYAKGHVVKYGVRGETLPLQLPGAHNQSNAQAALAVIRAVAERTQHFDKAAATTAIEQFAGLSHRLALVHTLKMSDGRSLKFFNDSKATSPDASITAINAFNPHSAIFFAGGYDKHIDLSEYERSLAEHAAGVIGIGQTGAAIVGQVRATGARAEYAETLERGMLLATAWAKADARVTAVVLSPASASWGQFSNYEERGEKFIALAKSTQVN